MKTNNTINNAMLLLLGISLLTGHTSYAQQLADQAAAQSRLTQILGGAHKNENGMQLKYVDKSTVDQVIRNVGGKATVDFGFEKIQIDNGANTTKGNDKVKSGSGVIIGSGADKLVSTSDADEAKQYVVQAPVLPKTSITVVGRLGKAQEGPIQFCLAKYATDEQKHLLKSGGPISPLNRCGDINQPIRLNEGLYRIYQVDKRFESNFYVGFWVYISEGENKIIPLREIVVPKYNSGQKISFSVYPANSIKDYAKVTYSICSPDKSSESLLKCLYGGSGIDSKNIRKAFEKSQSPEEFVREVILLDINEQTKIKSYFFAENGIADSTDGNFVSVFPGEYTIFWKIDDNYEEPTTVTVD